MYARLMMTAGYDVFGGRTTSLARCERARLIDSIAIAGRCRGSMIGPDERLHEASTLNNEAVNEAVRTFYKCMTLATDEFIRLFLIHILPHGFHRIRHYGLFAKATCAANIARARELLVVSAPQDKPDDLINDNERPSHPCPC